jgi:hypothetical protein
MRSIGGLLVPFLDERTLQALQCVCREFQRVSRYGDAHGVSAAARHDIQTLLGRTAAVFDWTGLGLHTGSRLLGKYGQSKPEKGSAFARVPQGPCEGQALAFIQEDFVYYDADGHLLSLTTLLAKPESAATFHVTFRYDKSATNLA